MAGDAGDVSGCCLNLRAKRLAYGVRSLDRTRSRSIRQHPLAADPIARDEHARRIRQRHGRPRLVRAHERMGHRDAAQTAGAHRLHHHARFGDRAPALNSIGQSLYEGMHFLAALLENRPEFAGRVYPSAREAVWHGGSAKEPPIYLAEAIGHGFRVVTAL